MKKFQQIIAKFKNARILVIGDLILDQYIQGSVSRISPEAPVPVVLEEDSFFTPGGAANVAHNLVSLGAKVALFGKIGDDLQGRILKEKLAELGINPRHLLVDKKMPTITKTRVLAQHQQVVRIDRERPPAAPLKENDVKFQKMLEQQIKKIDAIIISDYGKGLINQSRIKFIQKLAQKHNKILTVDPKVENFSFYEKVTTITPNLKEAENAIKNIKITAKKATRLAVDFEKLITDDQIDHAGQQILKYLNLDSLLITLGEKGMKLFEKRKKPFHIPTIAQEVYDVTGAGDAVISVFTLASVVGSSRREAAQLANTAAGIVVGKLGAAAIHLDELEAHLEGLDG